MSTTAKRDFLARLNVALAQDTYQRSDISANTTIATGWGTASDGNTWTGAGGGYGTMTFAISGNEGQVTASTGVTYAILGSGTDTNTRVDARFSVSNVNDTFGVVLCWSAANNHYRVRYNGGTAALEIVKVVSGTTTVIGTTPFTLTAGLTTYYRIAGIILSGTLTAKIWAVSSTEASATTVSIADSAFTSGQYGLSFNLSNVSHTINVDHFAVTDASPISGTHSSWDFLGRFNLAGVVGGSPYGFCTENKINQSTGAFTFLPQHTVNDMASIGCTRLRVQVRWGDIETNPTYPHPNGWTPAYQWNLLDDAVAKCRDAQKIDGTPSPINVIVPIQDTPSQYLLQPCGNNGFQPDPTETARFAADMAARYNGVNDCISNPNNTNPTGTNYGKLFVEAFHYNENYSNPGNPGSNPNGTCGDATLWCNVHKKVYPAIKAQSPKALVGAPSITTGMHYDPNNPTVSNVSYIKDWCTKACQQLFPATPIDFWDFHFYHGGVDPDSRDASNTNISFPERWQTIQAVTNSFNLNIPIWMCEFGYRGGTDLNVPNADLSYAKQAQYMLKELEEARTSGPNGIVRVYWFTIGGETQATSDPTKYNPISLTMCKPDGTNDGNTPPSPMVQGVASAPYNANATASVKPPAWNTLYAEMQQWPTWTGSSPASKDFLCRFNLQTSTTGGAAKDFLCRFNLGTASPTQSTVAFPAVSRRNNTLPAVSRRIHVFPAVSRRS